MKDLLPGDLVHLTSGCIVPADVRVVKTNNMKVDRGLLTGESKPMRLVVVYIVVYLFVDRKYGSYTTVSLSNRKQFR